jgi:HSP20 family protein
LELQLALKRLRNRGVRVGVLKLKTMPALRATAGVFTWKSYWKMDGMATDGCLERLAGFRRALDEATDQHATPRADVAEDKDAYRFYVEMPGLEVSSIDVQIEGDSLMVAAERKRPKWPQETQLHIAERGYSPIRRAFTLPLNARRDNIRAAYTDGVLELTVEKRAESKPVKVKVNN